MTEQKQEPDYIGHRKRLRNRFLLGGGNDMADYELLELVLTMALPRKDVKPLAKILINKFNSFAGVINAPKEELLAIDGIKETTLTMLKVIQVATQRVSWQRLSESEVPVITNTASLIDYCRTVIGFSDVEEFHLIYLDTKLHILGKEIMQRGTINTVAIHPREVIKAAMSNKASSIIMLHNHPSGEVKPSSADISMTQIISNACRAVGMKLVDHIIISRSDYYSFAKHMVL